MYVPFEMCAQVIYSWNLSVASVAESNRFGVLANLSVRCRL